jgi:regulator of replication initiation timing
VAALMQQVQQLTAENEALRAECDALLARLAATV